MSRPRDKEGMRIEEPSGKPKAMILSVGGTAAPIVASLNAQQPGLVCFFVSPESRPKIKEEILDKLAYQPSHHDWIETPSAEDLLTCCRTLLRELPRLADKWKIPLADFAADYTGGTKTMSVALALATIPHVSRYTYVGGLERTKEGLGIVVNGKERVLYQVNPWDALAVSARRRASLLFNRGRYEAAADEFKSVADRISPGERAVYQGLEALARGYAEWDRFGHRRAQELLSKSLRTLEPFAFGAQGSEWSAVVNRARTHVELLRSLAEDDGDERRIADLIANSRRRGDLESRYDDAVARLYSAIEMAGRRRLEEAHGITASNVRPDQVPEALRQEYRRRYAITEGERAGNLRLPLSAAYRLLVELQDELGARYLAREHDLRGLLESRNKSILAHGGKPVSQHLYQRFLDLVCEVVGVRQDGLPEFPDLPE